MPHRKWVVQLSIVLVLAAVLFLGYMFYRFVSTPSRSQITTPTSSLSSLSNTSTFNNTPVTVRNSYFSFSHPAALKPYVQQPVTAPMIANYSYGYRDIESWELTITAQTIPQSTLTNDSAYSYRSQHPEQFQLVNETINGHPVAVMTDAQASGFSKVAFVLQGNYIINVSLYGNDTSGTDILSSVFSQVLNSLQWNAH